MAGKLFEPTLAQVLAFCGERPIERVFLEDVARRGLGRLQAVAHDGRVTALCHAGANVVPAGSGCQAFAPFTAAAHARMILGEDRAVEELWRAAAAGLPAPREDRPGQPVFVLEELPRAAGTGLRPAAPDDLPLLVPACAAAYEHELGVDPLESDPAGFRERTLRQIEERRSWLWTSNGTILFKAEASAWTPSAVQLQQIWVDPAVRGRGYAKRGLADLCRLLLRDVPAVCLFVRTDNTPATGLYEALGMRRALTYRSVLF
jgi:uncharacterized protein